MRHTINTKNVELIEETLIMLPASYYMTKPKYGEAGMKLKTHALKNFEYTFENGDFYARYTEKFIERETEKRMRARTYKTRIFVTQKLFDKIAKIMAEDEDVKFIESVLRKPIGSEDKS